MAGLVSLSAVLTLFHKKCGVVHEWQQCGSCGAAFDKVTEVRISPKLSMPVRPVGLAFSRTGACIDTEIASASHAGLI